MAFSDLLKGINQVQNTLSGNSQQIISGNDFDSGFVAVTTPAADGTGLPSSKISSGRYPAVQKRKLIHWFVPEFGVVRMYVNPQSIQYNESKAISPVRTKGGFVVQYWGDNLIKLTISGITGSSGVEGLNVLNEVYHAEQLAFDSIGLTLASNANVSGLENVVDSVSDSISDAIGGSIVGAVGGVVNDVLGSAVDPGTGNILPQQLPSLAAMALGVELYYDGWTFRGFFTDMNYSESAEKIGMFDYTIQFTVTQKRGYRTNSMAWQRSAIDGPSNNSIGGVPMTFSSNPNSR